MMWECPTVKQVLPNQGSPRQLQLPLVCKLPSDQSIKMGTPNMLASFTAMLTSIEHRSSDSAPPAITRAHQASSRSFVSQLVPWSLAQASCWARSFLSQPASPLSLALASQLLQELCPASCRQASSQSPGYHKEIRSKSLWQWYIITNIMFLDIIHRSVFIYISLLYHVIRQPSLDIFSLLSNEDFYHDGSLVQGLIHVEF
jgi:hypothetical protein